MKELEIKEQASQEIVAEHKKDLFHFDSSRVIPGLTFFEYDPRTHKLRRAVYDKTGTVEINGDDTIVEQHVRYKMKVDPTNLYFQCLNEKNAVRKLAQMGLPVAP